MSSTHLCTRMHPPGRKKCGAGPCPPPAGGGAASASNYMYGCMGWRAMMRFNLRTSMPMVQAPTPDTQAGCRHRMVLSTLSTEVASGAATMRRRSVSRERRMETACSANRIGYYTSEREKRYVGDASQAPAKPLSTTHRVGGDLVPGLGAHRLAVAAGVVQVPALLHPDLFWKGCVRVVIGVSEHSS